MPPSDITSSPRSLTVALGELAAAMELCYDEVEFFRGLLTACGASTLLLTKALNAAADRGDGSVSHELSPALSRPDLAVPKWAYLRFVTDEADVLSEGEALLSLPCVQDNRNDYRCLLCVSPAQVGLILREDEERPERLFFPLSDLPAHYVALSHIDPGARPKLRKRAAASEDREADARACRRLNVLLEDLLTVNEIAEADRHGLHVFMCRLLFCLFAEDSGLFDEDLFVRSVRDHVGRDGSGAVEFFAELFAVLATPEEQRSQLGGTLSARLLAFPYVNGGLFDGPCFLPRFDAAALNQLIACCDLKWHQITPAVFGAMFQNAMDPHARRQEGAHYTAEANIKRVIRPLFLEELEAELLRIEAMAPRQRVVQLQRFQERIASLHFLDPACGCGNFLLIAYRELRRLENRILLGLQELRGGQTELSVSLRQMVSITQFHGIELEDWPVQIAHVSLYLMEHAMHEETNEKLGMAIPTLPLGRSHAIVCANALTTDWHEVLEAGECCYVMGNPPYAGVKTTSSEQKEWLRGCYPERYKVGAADFCTAWFVKAADYMAGNKDLRAAFVATNSICQGEQVATLWGLLLSRGIQLHFAWPSFPWRSEAAGGAGVTVIIVGFGMRPPAHGARLYQLQGGQIVTQEGPALTPYLTLGRTAGVIVRPHNRALSAPLEIVAGCKPADGGHLILEYDAGERLLEQHPEVRPFLRRYVGGAELMGSTWRYCLWLKDEDRAAWEQIPEIMRRVEACRAFRSGSVKAATRRDAATPWRFQEVRSLGEALVVPQTTSERRPYVPLSFVDERYVVSVKALMAPGADEAHFAVLSSRMHMCWLRLTGGRMKTDYSYIINLVYNTYPWPHISETQHKELWELGDAVLMRREHYYQMELGKLYNQLPADLAEMHQAIDDYVEQLYRRKPFADDEERTAFLLELYAQAVAEEEGQAGGRGKR